MRDQYPGDELPPLPRRVHFGRMKREKLAREWLLRCSQNPTDQRVSELESLVGIYPPRSLYMQLADQIVATGNVPTPKSVRKLFVLRKKQRVAREARLQAKNMDQRPKMEADAKSLSETQADQITSWISDFTAVNGESPTWTELGLAFGWSNARVQEILNRLRADGRVTFDSSTRSLCVV